MPFFLVDCPNVIALLMTAQLVHLFMKPKDVPEIDYVFILVLLSGDLLKSMEEGFSMVQVGGVQESHETEQVGMVQVVHLGVGGGFF